MNIRTSFCVWAKITFEALDKVSLKAMPHVMLRYCYATGESTAANMSSWKAASDRSCFGHARQKPCTAKHNVPTPSKEHLVELVQSWESAQRLMRMPLQSPIPQLMFPNSALHVCDVTNHAKGPMVLIYSIHGWHGLRCHPAPFHAAMRARVL